MIKFVSNLKFKVYSHLLVAKKIKNQPVGTRQKKLNIYLSISLQNIKCRRVELNGKIIDWLGFFLFL
jgi:hypothetical protein